MEFTGHNVSRAYIKAPKNIYLQHRQTAKILSLLFKSVFIKSEYHLRHEIIISSPFP